MKSFLTVSLRAQNQPRTNPKNRPQSSCTQRLPQSRARGRDPRTNSSPRRSPQAGQPLSLTSAAPQESWDSTGPFLTRDFQESRPPPHASRRRGGLLKLDSGSKKETEYAKANKLSSIPLEEKPSLCYRLYEQRLYIYTL